MKLELRFFATFREAVGQKTLVREVSADVTVGEVLRDLEAEYPDLEGQLFEDGDLKSQVKVLKNGREVMHLDGLETRFEEGDALAVFPPVAGG